jgi:hypothetical protein
VDRFGAEDYLSVFSPFVRAEEATRFVRRQVDNQRIGWRSGYGCHADSG